MDNTDINELLKEISEHTNAWGGWWSTPLTVLTILASLATICGLIMIYVELGKHKASKRRQELIIKDLIRHVMVNAAIMEVVRMKMAGKWAKRHPMEGVFTRFCVLDSDLQLDQIKVKDRQYTKLHSLSLLLRNYNIVAQLAEKHLGNPDFDPREKRLELDDLLGRTIRITNEFIKLGKATRLDISIESVRKFITDHYDEKKANRQKPLPNITLPRRTGIRAFYDTEFGLSEVFDFCILDRYDYIRVIPFNTLELA